MPHCRDMSFFRVAIQEEYGRPTGLLQSLWGKAVRILLASADSSILIRWPNSMSLLFCMIEVRRGCSVKCRTSQLDTRWYQRISRILFRHHWSRASILLTSAFDRAQHSESVIRTALLAKCRSQTHLNTSWGQKWVVTGLVIFYAAFPGFSWWGGSNHSLEACRCVCLKYLFDDVRVRFQVSSDLLLSSLQTCQRLTELQRCTNTHRQ